MPHPQRLKNVCGYILFKRLAAHTLDHVPCKSYAVVRVTRHFPWRKDPPRLVFHQEFTERSCLLWIGQENVPNLLLEPAEVRHQVPQCNGFAEARRHLEIEIPVYARLH